MTIEMNTDSGATEIYGDWTSENETSEKDSKELALHEKISDEQHELSLSHREIKHLPNEKTWISFSKARGSFEVEGRIEVTFGGSEDAKVTITGEMRGFDDRGNYIKGSMSSKSDGTGTLSFATGSKSSGHDAGAAGDSPDKQYNHIERD